jgi:hypothetical protein
MNQTTGELAASPLILFLLQGVDQIDGREEANALLVVFDGLHAERGGEMGLACAWRTRGILPNITTPMGGSFIGITLATVRSWKF